jgi:hypothetical protein
MLTSPAAALASILTKTPNEAGKQNLELILNRGTAD